jgi:hypothetical protein
MSASIKAGLNNDMHLMTDGVTRAYVDGNGKVGIGTTSPSKKFVVSEGGVHGFEISPYDGSQNATRLINYNRSTNAYFPLEIEASQIAFETNGSEKMRIDSSGRVTTPYQPSFMAVGCSATPSSGSGWPWGSIIHNTGSHFSLATGRFTAPVAGKYMFFATFIGASGNDVYRYFTRKNNVNYPKANSQIRLDTAGSTNNDYEYGTSAILMDMAVGDYASIWFESSGGTNSHPGSANTNSGHEIFSGYLIG